MKFNRIILSKSVTTKLHILKGKTGLTPNILCRIGLSLSLKDPTIPDPDSYKQDGMEIPRSVLLGDLDKIFIALFKQRAYKDGFDLSDNKLLFDYFRAYVNRGAEMVYMKVKEFKDLKKLLM